MNVEDAKSVLVVGDRFTERELKKSFRRQALLCHSDHGGSDGAFIELQEAYDLLKDKAYVNGHDIKGLETVDGISLSELGKGFPLSVSAHSCDDCEGRGWKKYSSGEIDHYEKCPDCEGEGLHYVKCSRCNGTGDYVNQKTGKVTGKCFGCSGTGKFYPKRNTQTRFRFNMDGEYVWGRNMFYAYKDLPNGPRIPVDYCKKCKGNGKVPVKKSGFIYGKCDSCDGVGEIKIYNPVIPRGFIGRG